MLNDELAIFSRAIVCGEAPSSRVNTGYSHYSLDVAINVYRNNYRGNLHDTLAAAYPVIAQLVGEDFFRRLTRAYIGQSGSTSGNLHRYGDAMAEFLAEYEAVRDLAYLSDVAALEWACHRAYFSEDAAILEIVDLARVPPERFGELILYVNGSLLRSNYPVAAIWHAHQGEGDFQIDLNRGACCALVSRRDDVVEVVELTMAEADFLQTIQSAVPLGLAINVVQEAYPEFDLQAALHKLLTQNVLTHFDFGEGL
ncbi:MAG: DNA-binding domain-containing protein [Gallionella sp.]